MSILPFKYLPYPGDRLRPIIKATLEYGKTQIDFYSLVDSGSDVTISYEELGRGMGINFDDQELKKQVDKKGLKFDDKITGLTGSCPVYTVPIKLIFNNKETEIVVLWLRTRLDTKADFPLVLGQDSIFQIFDIYFSKRRHKFILTDEILPDLDKFFNQRAN